MPSTTAASHFLWKPEYSVGVEFVDTQHKKLIGIINQLSDAMAAGRGREVLGPILDELVLYTKRHFADEEKFLANFRYSDLAAHTAVHRSMTNQVIALRAKFNTGPIGNTVEVFNFLKAWLRDHILQRDMAYSREYLQRK